MREPSESLPREIQKQEPSPPKEKPLPLASSKQPETKDEEAIVAVRAKLTEIQEEQRDNETSVDLDSITLRKRLPLNWEALARLGQTINRLKKTPVSNLDLQQLRPPPTVYPAIPMLASFVAHNTNPETPVRLPTEKEIKDMEPWLRQVSYFIGKFSRSWSDKFNRFLEQRGAEKIAAKAAEVARITDSLGRFENPRAEFLQEIAKLYDEMATASYRPGEFFEPDKVEVSIESKIGNLLRVMRLASQSEDTVWVNSKTYPLLTTLLRSIRFYQYTFDEGQIAVAGVEVMVGIELFLRQQGIPKVKPAPGPQEFDLFNPNTWGRGLAEWFASEQLELVKKELPQILSQAHESLPTDGPELVEKIYQIAKNILFLKRNGKTDKEIVDALFAQ